MKNATISKLRGHWPGLEGTAQERASRPARITVPSASTLKGDGTIDRNWDTVRAVMEQWWADLEGLSVRELQDRSTYLQSQYERFRGPYEEALDQVEAVRRDAFEAQSEEGVEAALRTFRARLEGAPSDQLWHLSHAVIATSEAITPWAWVAVLDEAGRQRLSMALLKAQDARRTMELLRCRLEMMDAVLWYRSVLGAKPPALITAFLTDEEIEEVRRWVAPLFEALDEIQGRGGKYVDRHGDTHEVDSSRALRGEYFKRLPDDLKSVRKKEGSAWEKLADLLGNQWPGPGRTGSFRLEDFYAFRDWWRERYGP